MDESISLWSDGASLCIFDPMLFEGTKPADEWPYHSNPGVRDGLFALVGLQGDGGYRLRVTDRGLTPQELDILNDTIGPLGVSVRSGQVYASGMDWPGELTEVYLKHGAGAFVTVAPGDYEVTIHELRATLAVERGLPDYVAMFHPRTGPFLGVAEEPRFVGGKEFDEWLQERGMG